MNVKFELTINEYSTDICQPFGMQTKWPRKPQIYGLIRDQSSVGRCQVWYTNKETALDYIYINMDIYIYMNQWFSVDVFLASDMLGKEAI